MPERRTAQAAPIGSRRYAPAVLLAALSMILAGAGMIALGYLVWVLVNRQDPVDAPPPAADRRPDPPPRR